jgi:hypothetical protein
LDKRLFFQLADNYFDVYKKLDAADCGFRGHVVTELLKGSLRATRKLLDIIL